jgi:hypothetical protein
MDDSTGQVEKGESTIVVQGEFDQHAGVKKEVYEFLETCNLFTLIFIGNIFLCHYPFANVDFLHGIMSDDVKYFYHSDIIARKVE